LGPQLKKDHPEVKIMIYDHNKDDVFIWASEILSDPDAAKYVHGKFHF
jgi:glucosylceramidase